MSLHPHVIAPVPEETARVARAAFPKGHPSLTFRDALGTIFQDEGFAPLFPAWGPPGVPPWRLALVTIMQFREHLADRHAAEAVRARIDWKYLLRLELTDPGFDFSVLSAFRDRLLAGSAAALLLEKLLERCRALGLLTARGQQRTDSTHVLAAFRVLNRFALVAETLRAALTALATVAPNWLQAVSPLAWYERYSRRIEASRLPQAKAAREAYAHTVGEDGFLLLDALKAPDVPEDLRALPSIAALRQTWQRHDEWTPCAPAAPGASSAYLVRFKANRDLPPAAEGIESPYDVEARYRHKRDTQWTGSRVHVSETCEPTAPHLLTHVHTTPATVHEAQCTAPIQQALIAKGVPPQEHFVDAAYISAELLVHSYDAQGITLRDPTRPSQGWQTQVEGAYTLEQFAVDWDQSRCAAPKATRQSRGRSMGVGRAVVPSLSHAASTCVGRVPYGPAVPVPYTPVDGCGCRPGTRTRHCKRRNPGRRARQGSSAINGGPASKGRSPRGSTPLACAGPATGARRRRTCSMSRSLPRSTSTALSRGSTSAHGPRRAPPVLSPSPLLAPYPASRWPQPTTADLPGPMLLHSANAETISLLQKYFLE